AVFDIQSILPPENQKKLDSTNLHVFPMELEQKSQMLHLDIPIIIPLT
ncbi:hypothetical protein TNCT_608931, partial [Trichonephila clavata]